MSQNPFEDASSNPWSDGRPNYGNAYDNTPPALPPRIKETPTLVPSSPYRTQPSPYETQHMPSHSAYQQPSWQQQESNKVLQEPAYNNTNVYQYPNTPYGSSSPTVTASAYSPQPTHTENNTTFNNDYNTKPESVATPAKTTPSKLRVLFRIILFIFSVGHLGFAAGASPYSGKPIPFDSSTCFYFLFAVAVMSIIYSGFHVFLYLFRRFGNVALWGIGIIVEIMQYRCSPGGHNHWCDFYNTSIFFGFVSFILYVVLVGWDIVGGCKARKK
ncbi:hypothetical protein G6F46_000707 [Rhizopus delemar]|uniref:MARVEL domain-containing protein n=1 Tax=Rhizopus oryzae TaxID=64495 RepID=A0A9P6YN35_RHIOR|nr:hypothetical protein G6F54_005738 [Rhizopus delemar]KAG1518497.1 hypothetical protein G6F53_000536 [Rhizopus delemar]KAG1552932.1 hypothetical protein G6F51_000908 [Rhizopus arrhizus]KAG1622587.1 hypothetical protein G6F46_000707 [Rhizopus delemar]KAG1623650.1 hypothetical protein G6F45_010772 [Rhizopus arrhizus]